MLRAWSRRSRIVSLVLSATLCAVAASAEVTRVDIRNRADVLGGRSFGDAGQNGAYASARIDADPPLARGHGRPGAAPHRAGNDVGATRESSN